MDWAKITAQGDEKHFSFDIWCDLCKRFYGNVYSVEMAYLNQINDAELYRALVKESTLYSPISREIANVFIQ